METRGYLKSPAFCSCMRERGEVDLPRPVVRDPPDRQDSESDHDWNDLSQVGDRDWGIAEATRIVEVGVEGHCL